MCGRADRRRKPRLANCLPTVRSNQCAASAQPHRFRGRDPAPTLLLCRAATGWIRRATVEQARHALRIVTVGPIPQRLPIHAAVFCRRLAVNPIQNQGNRQHPSRRFPIPAPRRFLAKLACGVILTAIKASLALMPLNQITPLVGIPLSQIWGPLVSLMSLACARLATAIREPTDAVACSWRQFVQSPLRPGRIGLV